MFVEAQTVASSSVFAVPFGRCFYFFLNIWKYISKYYNSIVNHRVVGIDKSVAQSENIIRKKQKALFYCSMLNSRIARLS